ncbi:hypothetical protein C8J27_101277 [Rhodobacter aestuarii]|uniref:Uncharacterized protein n=1 Tax=Rhodobacter aestuarii TaxID=453582 RepID=A0A1N7J5J4_9RHOB|nr:hypothetical protein [Rhodobacter aestuarii]PTV97167.1 hypothetical protein C8J27_101277 [Rhodobacter aestuarii]SIS44501.1 hypothetical protein SAMN05421580_101365 [Rhodobacter aestuarii]
MRLAKAAVALLALCGLVQPVKADQASLAAEIAALGTREVSSPEGPKRDWLETEVSDCTLHWRKYVQEPGQEKYLLSADAIPLEGVLFRKVRNFNEMTKPDAATKAPNDGAPALAAVEPVPSAPETTPPEQVLLYLDYTMTSGWVVERLVPVEKDPRAPFRSGPVIAGRAYVIAERNRGGVFFQGLQDLDLPNRYLHAIETYRDSYCRLLG